MRPPGRRRGTFQGFHQIERFGQHFAENAPHKTCAAENGCIQNALLND
jgi:hypothetical protein